MGRPRPEYETIRFFKFIRASPHLVLNLTFIMQFGRIRFRKLYFSEIFSKFWKAAAVQKLFRKLISKSKSDFRTMVKNVVKFIPFNSCFPKHYDDLEISLQNSFDD
jgi:hypothetical protein